MVLSVVFSPRTHTLLIDTLPILTQKKHLSELLSILELSRTGKAISINQLLGSAHGAEEYPQGLYYLKEECYVIATWRMKP